MIKLTNNTNKTVHQLIALCSPNTVFNIILHSPEKQLIDINCCSCSSSVVVFHFQSHSCPFLLILIVNIIFIHESLFIVICS